jgi:hypothetical protein
VIAAGYRAFLVGQLATGRHHNEDAAGQRRCSGHDQTQVSSAEASRARRADEQLADAKLVLGVDQRGEPRTCADRE